MSRKQESKVKERLKDGDEIVLEPFGHPVTTNEIHAAQLGLVGLFAGLGYSIGYAEEAIIFSAGLVLVAFGVAGIDDYKPNSVVMAIMTKRREPWWFTTSYVLTFCLGILLQNGDLIGYCTRALMATLP